MKNSLNIFFIFLCLGINAQDATEIIKKADEKMQGKSNSAEMTMTIQRPDWQREVKIKSWAKGQELSLILITAPARDKGAAFLKRDKELWNWQPRIDRVIKLPPSMMMQSWMGSDFTNDDLVKQSSIVTDYHHQLLGDTLIDNYECYKIILVPKDDAPVVWGKIDAYITKDDLLQKLIKYYDEDGYLINTMVLKDIRDIGGRVIPTRLEMIPADEVEQKTVIRYIHIAFDIDIPDQFFSLQNMKKVR